MSSFIGRLLFAGVFLSAGIHKLSTFDFETGGTVSVEHTKVGPKMDAFLKHMDSSGLHLPITKDMYPALLFTAIMLEVCGAVLFVFNSRRGAQMLLLFLAAVTPVMHQFWDTSSSQQHEDTLHFYKNTSLAGALLFYLALRR